MAPGSEDQGVPTSLRLTHTPDVRLRLPCVEARPDEVPDVLAMAALLTPCLAEWKGVGIAANQAGFNHRFFVYDDRKGHRGVMVNPTVQDVSPESSEDDEGCLSYPGVWVPMRRSDKVLISGITGPRDMATFWAEGLLARIFQHEIDHLNGVTIVPLRQPHGGR